MRISDWSSDVCSSDLGLAMKPFSRVIKDYFTVCESYYDAIKTASPSRIEAIDMGRRALHHEGSDLLRRPLDGKIAVDDDKTRRLFTLLLLPDISGCWPTPPTPVHRRARWSPARRTRLVRRRGGLPLPTH